MLHEKTYSRTDRLIEAYGRQIVKWRWLVVLLSFILVLAAANGVQFLTFTGDYKVFFSEENPELQAFENLQKIYTKADNIILVVTTPEDKVFNKKDLQLVKDMTDDAWQVPHSIRVDSLSNYQHTYAEEDDLIVEDLVDELDYLTAEDLIRIEEVALNEPLLVNRSISPNGKTTGVQVTLQLPEGDMVAIAEAVEFARDVIEKYETAYPDHHFALTGQAVLSHSFPEASQQDMQTLMPLMLGVIILTLMLFLRSPIGTIVTIFLVFMSILFAMGLAGWLGWQLTPPSASAPIIIMTLAIADAVHIFVIIFREMRRGMNRHDAVVESLRINFQPVFLTSLTTVIGFMSLNFSDAPPFHDLGNISAFGVVMAWFLSMTFLPAMAAILPIRVKTQLVEKSPMAERIGEFVIEKRTPLLIGMAILSIGLTALTPTLNLDDRFVEYFDESIPFRVDSDYTTENLTGVYLIEYSVGAGSTGAISEPEYLQKLDDFVAWARSQGDIIHVNTITDTMKRLNKSMHGDDQSYYKMPNQRDLAAQYLLMYEMSLPYGLDLNSQINVDKSATRVTITTANISSNRLREIAKEGQMWLRDNGMASMESVGSGASVMFSNIAYRNIREMLLGTFVAFVLISVALLISLKSFRLGFISLLPNLLPVFMTFGIWALLFGQIGMSAAVVTATALGLIVDATVHFLSKYERGRQEKGLDSTDSVRYAFSTVGTALWVTTAILVCGFAILGLSAFRVNAEMGMLTAIAIAIALIVDFLMLPPLLMLIDRRKTSAKTSETDQPVAQSAQA